MLIQGKAPTPPWEARTNTLAAATGQNNAKTLVYISKVLSITYVVSDGRFVEVHLNLSCLYSQHRIPQASFDVVHADINRALHPRKTRITLLDCSGAFGLPVHGNDKSKHVQP